MNLDEWRDQLSYRYFTKDRQLGVEQLQDSFIANFVPQFGKPYYFGGGNLDEIFLNPPAKNVSNRDFIGNWAGYDCCGGVMSSARETFAKYVGLDPNSKAIWSLLPSLEQNGMLEQSWIAKYDDKNRLMPSDLIFIDLGAIAGDYGPYDHVMTYAGSGAIDRYFSDFKNASITQTIKQNGNDVLKKYPIVPPNSDIITTKGGDDPRQGATPYGITAAWNFEQYNEYEAGLRPQYKYGRINWSLLIEKYKRSIRK
jgi:hypothetical protein